MNKNKLEDILKTLREVGLDVESETKITLQMILEALLEEPQIQCPHDWSQGTSGFTCKKCGQMKTC